MSLHLQKPVNFPDIQGPPEDRVIMLFGCLFIVVSKEMLEELLFKNIIRMNKNLAVPYLKTTIAHVCSPISLQNGWFIKSNTY